MEEKTNPKWGLTAGLLAYILWGVLPFYWKAVGVVSAISILSYRVLWSFVFMNVVLLLTKNGQVFGKKLKSYLIIKRG